MAAARIEEEVGGMSSLVFRAKVREVLNSTDLTDPHDVADAVLEAIPRKQYEDVLRLLLTDYVRSQMSHTRLRAPQTPISSFPDVKTTKHAGGVTSKSLSTKVTAIRDGWQRHLRDRIGVGPNTYKMLRDCTYDDLMHAAQQRTKLADQHKAWAARFNAYAALLTEFDVKTFGELPVEVHMKVLGVAA